MRAWLLALALSAGPVGAAVPPPAEGAEAERISPAAAALAELVVPADRAAEMDLAVTRQGIVAAFAKELGAGWQAEYPGLLEAIWSDLEPELRRFSARNRPALMQRLATLYTARLTESEMATLDRFYRSPTGQKTIRIMYEESDFTPVVDDMLDDEDADVSAEAIRRAHESGKARLLNQLSEEDKAALVELARTLPVAKMKSVGAEVQRVTVEWINEDDPEFEARIESLMKNAVERYFERNPPEG